MRVIFLFSIVLISIVLSGCEGGATPANSTGGNTVTGNTNNPLETTKKTPEPTINNAPTLTPVFKAYCDAWVKNNEAALRKVYSSDTIKDFESQMKEEKVKSLLKFLEDDKVSGTPCEVRNEEITGDKAVAEIKADKYPNGIKVFFVKQNGEWKLTNKYPTLDTVKQTTANSNTAK